MATKIRLKRIGRRNRPFYRLVVMDSRQRRDGAAIEELGWYNPIAKNTEQDFSLKADRILYWLSVGAQTTEIAHHLLKRAGITYKWHLMKKGLDDATIEKEMQKWTLDREEIIKRRAKKAAPKTKTEDLEEETISVQESAEPELTAEKEITAEEGKEEAEVKEPDTETSAEEKTGTEETSEEIKTEPKIETETQVQKKDKTPPEEPVIEPETEASTEEPDKQETAGKAPAGEVETKEETGDETSDGKNADKPVD